jgi:hypothetical protein
MSRESQSSIALPLGSANLTRDLRIDGYQANLSLVTYVTVDHSGTIVIDQPQDAKILFFSPSGRRLGEFGRRGNGPGEFEQLGPLGWLGDTLWVFDLHLLRFTMISPGRKLVATVRAPLFARSLPDQPTAPLTQPVTNGWLLPNGDLLLESLIYGMHQPGSWAEALKAKDGVILRVSRDGAFRAMLLAFSVLGEQCSWYSGTTRVSIPQCPRPLRDIGNYGGKLATVSTNMSGPRAGTYLVTVRRIGGDTIFSRRYPFVGVPIGAHATDSIRARMLAQASPGAIHRALEHVPFSPDYPPVKQIRVGRDNTTWVGLRQTADGLPWLALDQAGNPIGEVILPPTVVLWVADRHTIWGVDWDQNDMPSIVRYQLTWPR